MINSADRCSGCVSGPLVDDLQPESSLLSPHLSLLLMLVPRPLLSFHDAHNTGPSPSLCVVPASLLSSEILPQWQFTFVDMPRNIGAPDPQHPAQLPKAPPVPDEETEVQILE